MSLKNYSKYRSLVYSYLDFKGVKESKEINELIEECTKEVEENNTFLYIYQEFDYILSCLNKEPYLEFLSGCRGYYLSMTTLGPLIDQKIKYYSKTNLTKMIVLDACASAYLEYRADESEELLGDNLTYRFCPGYGGSSVNDLFPLAKILDIRKFGVDLLDSGLMVPQKSMIGIIGIDKQIEKSCVNCINNNACKYKKEGRVCYN